MSNSFSKLAEDLLNLRPDLDLYNVADYLWWLALHPPAPAPASESTPAARPPNPIDSPLCETSAPPETDHASGPFPIQAPLPEADAGRSAGGLYAPSRADGVTEDRLGIPLRVPGTAILPHQLDLGRALRPLKRRVASPKLHELDEEATAQASAEAEEVIPILRPRPERWLSLDLVAEDTETMQLWERPLREFRHLLERSGIFSCVRSWQCRFVPGSGSIELRQGDRISSPRQLCHADGRGVVLLATDSLDLSWGSEGAVWQRWLAGPGRANVVGVLQLLPEAYWETAAIGPALERRVPPCRPTGPEGRRLADPARLPLTTLAPPVLARWVASVVGKSACPGLRLERCYEEPLPPGTRLPDARELLDYFWQTASLPARDLARLLVAVPLYLPVVRLVQHQLLPESGQSQLAEFYLSGLIERGKASVEEQRLFPGEDATPYYFRTGVQELLLEQVGRQELQDAQKSLDGFMREHFGAGWVFDALLEGNYAGAQSLPPGVQRFAQASAYVMAHMGPAYAHRAAALQDRLGRGPGPRLTMEHISNHDNRQTLEEIVGNSILLGNPKVISVERVLTQIFGELHRQFYHDAEQETSAPLGFYHDRLARGDVSSAWHLWMSNLEFQNMRRTAIWLTSVSFNPERPEAPDYLDPVDYLRWLFMVPAKAPPSLIGRSHGNLHGRNILAEISRRGVENPVIIGFGDSGLGNLPVGDFAMLEVELKCRILPLIVDDPLAREALSQKVPPLGKRSSSTQELPPEDKLVAERINRTGMAYQFERLLLLVTERSVDNQTVGSRSKAGKMQRITGHPPLDRALYIFLRIRQEAAHWLGVRMNRFGDWAKEYYLALSVYGLLSANREIDGPFHEWALMSSGLAAAVIGRLNDQVDLVSEPSHQLSTPPPANYQVAWTWAHKHRRKGAPAAGVALLSEATTHYPEALPLRAEYALCLAASGKPSADPHIEGLVNYCRRLQDFEALARWGKRFKAAGDEAWARDPEAPTWEQVKSTPHPVRFCYHQAWKLYLAAGNFSKNYFPKINAATLALLGGNREECLPIAGEVARTCANLPFTSTADQFWIDVTQGEAALLLGKTAEAVNFYEAALSSPVVANMGQVDSVYQQLCRLYWGLGGDKVQPVLDLLDRMGFLSIVTPGPFGNCGLPVTTLQALGDAIVSENGRTSSDEALRNQEASQLSEPPPDRIRNGELPAGRHRQVQLPHKKRLLLSHKSEDKPAVEQIDALLRFDYEILYDKYFLSGGDEIAPRIRAEIDRADVVLVALSRRSVTSKWVKFEVDYARQQHKELRPIRLDDVPIPDDLADFLWIDAGEYLRELQFSIDGGRASRILRHSPEILFGREPWLEKLDAAWDRKVSTAPVESVPANVITVVAFGGIGKTSLAAHWVDSLRHRHWCGVQRYFDWSFYSQGSSETSQSSADAFIAEALQFFGDVDPTKGSAWERGQRLAGLIRQRRTLLVLDGVEPLQHGPGHATWGKLKDHGLESLLKTLSQENPGLCVVTTRESVADLAHFRASSAPEWKLDSNPENAAIEMLRQIGVMGSEDQLREVCVAAKGHALTLQILGRFLVDAFDGDVRRWKEVKLKEAAVNDQGNHAFHAMEAYERWLGDGEVERRRELAVLRLMGLFDRPAPSGCLQALREGGVIPGLTEEIAAEVLSEAQWKIALKRLEEVNLIAVQKASADGAPRNSQAVYHLDAHPLVREYFAMRLQETEPEAWRVAHGRLFDHLCETTPHQPDGPEGLQPLYQAVAHGCLAGRHQEACAQVYHERILRGSGDDGHYSIRQLGSFGADLGAVACFFEGPDPWRRPSPNLRENDQAWLLTQAAFYLRALGRLTEALAPMQAGLAKTIAAENWRNAAASANNLSELELTLGDLPGAERDGRQAVDLADRGGDLHQRMVSRATAANVLFQAGQTAEAAGRFRGAEAIQGERQSEFPLLYSVPGFQYCELILASVERAAWKRFLESKHGSISRRSTTPYRLELDVLHETRRRAGRTLSWGTSREWLVAMALDRLTLAKVALFESMLREAPGYVLAAASPSTIEASSAAHEDRSAPVFASATAEIISSLDQSIDGLRLAGQVDHLALGLQTRAWAHVALSGNEASANRDLHEAWDIAAPGPMRLYLADIQLIRGRLFRDAAAFSDGKRRAAELRYHRRDEEIRDAEVALGVV